MSDKPKVISELERNLNEIPAIPSYLTHTICRRSAIKQVITMLERQNKRIKELEEQIDALEKMPTIDAVPVWVSVKDRLPNEKINPNTHDFEYVLCYTIFGDVRAYKYGTPMLNKLPHFWHGDVSVDEYVTHWQYMPEPPKEVSE